jgi:hypothetical protein
MVVFVANPTAYTNDAYGRRISETTGGAITTYTWNAVGHLVQVACSGRREAGDLPERLVRASRVVEFGRAVRIRRT